ncbi:selenocysteine-specific translation factor [Methylopila jiangsuensis]|uniref:Selenocysteine-specific elongation factor n=1 Tax=Methylopila jiangsuensis TaxID=586230 RepID=A0A9W6JH44_9HYPH|nr:selenocysteine-specific translation elongation factor [Methylopila jiangsuensis]MDR6285891.1 selenocysteine-specific elongation factor [Methylopila jiangsuensis]GLK75649.1 selenocysteine-specific translation factor [Methylopila jiangsuensis]
MIVGTAGHIDHGKSALVKALTGVETDRLKEEKARGISIDLGFAYSPRADGQVLGFVDVPGHERFVRNMLAGASGIDLVLLVVAADDGPMPQTREHLAIVDLLGVRRGLVALTKTDLVDAARLAEAESEVVALLGGTGLEGADILPVSAVTGDGVAALSEKLDALRAQTRERPAEGRFRLAVDRCFTLQGAGTVVTGAVRDGVVRVGDPVIVSPSGLTARVRAIHAQNRAAEEGRPGERCALNLAGPGVAKDAIRRGDVVCAAELHAPTERIDVSLRLLSGEPRPMATWTPARLHHGAAEIAARVVPLDGDHIAPGAEVRAQLVLEQPLAAAALDRFVLRDTSGQRTVAGGRILDLRAPARRRRSPERLAQLAALAKDDPAEAVAELLAVPPGTVDLDGFARDRNLGPGAAARLAETLDLVRLAGPRGAAAVVTRDVWDAFAADLAARLAVFHADSPDLQGVGAERLRLMVEPRLAAPAFLGALARLQREGAIAVDGAWVRRPEHTARLAPADEALWAEIGPRLGGATRFRPPRVRDLAHELGEDEADIRRALKLVSRLGQADEIAHDHFFPREVTSELVEVACAAAAADPRGVLTAAAFRDRLDNGRKVAIQILEFFDRHGVTIRRGDERRINSRRRDLFRRAPVTEQEA